MIARSIKVIDAVSHRILTHANLRNIHPDSTALTCNAIEMEMIKNEKQKRDNFNSSISRSVGIFENAFRFSSTKLTKQQIQSSTYDELIDKITKIYNYQQYKIPSALALLEIHHQYKIFKAGDWVLDIGAGPNWSWTDLALKLTHSPRAANKVISNDLHEPTQMKAKSNNVVVTGNFLQEPTRTKIAMNLIDRRLDTIFVDATLKFTGNEQLDSEKTMQVFIKALQFSEHYLKKGGTIVLRTITSSATMQNQMQAKFFFNEVYRFKSSAFRIDSPCCFYIMRGYMMSENYKALQKLLIEYNKAQNHYSKTQIVENYRNKYPWDPVMLLNNYAKNNIVKMREEGKKNKQIMKYYENDPYIKAGEILSLLDKIQSKETTVVQKMKAENKLNNKQEINLPENQQEFADILFKHVEEIEKEVSQGPKRKNKKGRKHTKQKVEQKAKIQNKAPLAENQIYMKSNNINTSQQQDPQKFNYREYTEEDLYGFNSQNPFRSINKFKPMSMKEQDAQNHVELQKLIRSFPEVEKTLRQNNTTLDDSVKKFEKQFRKKYFDEQEKQDQTNNKKPKTKLKSDLQGEQNNNSQLDDDQFLYDHPGAKTKAGLHHRNSDLNSQRKSQMESQFDFNNMANEPMSEKMKEKQHEEAYDRQLNQMNKVQYLRSKPSKAERPINKSSKKSNNQSYFKQKKKDKF